MPHPILDCLASLGRDLSRRLRPRHADTDPRQTDDWLRAAAGAREGGRHDEAIDLYRQVLGRRDADRIALGGLREAALAAGRFPDALDAQQRLLATAAPAERRAEAERLARIHYQRAGADLDAGRAAAAVPHLKSALRAARDFMPAALALGEAQALSGDAREAVRTWERAVEVQPSLPILSRLEQAYRDEGRPTRMIALYRDALNRAPDDIAVAVALGRVYLELEMLEEAADELEKVEACAPDLAVVHAYLASVFERRGEWREACAEYRRALQLGRVWDWPHRCTLCGASAAGWQDRCPSCGSWNSLRPDQPGGASARPHQPGGAGTRGPGVAQSP